MLMISQTLSQVCHHMAQAVSCSSRSSTKALLHSLRLLCRRDGKAITLSQDALLVALVSTAQAVRDAAEAKGLTRCVPTRCWGSAS